MITGTHFLLYSDNAEADRIFFRDVLDLPHVDAGGGWLIFQMPPAETALHPREGESSQDPGGHRVATELYLTCDDLKSQIALFQKKNIECSEVVEARWGLKTTIPLPSGGHIGLYQPRHRTAFGLKSKPSDGKNGSAKKRTAKKQMVKRRSAKKRPSKR